MEKPKVSVIIPIYNPGERLCQCVDTLVNQTLKDIEFIFVLDCPTDNSEEFLCKYAAKDERIIIIKNEHNMHIGLTRNRGLEVAQGEYIAFSDHDDYRELTMYEKLYTCAIEEDADIVLSPTVEDTEGDIKVFYYPENVSISGRKLWAVTLSNLISGGGYTGHNPYAVNIHSNIYRRKLIDEHNMRFVDTRKVVPEDRLWNISCLLRAERVALVNKPLYYHVIYSESAVNGSEYIDQISRLRSWEVLYNELIETGWYETFEEQFLHSVSSYWNGACVNNFHHNHKAYHKIRAFMRQQPYYHKLKSRLYYSRLGSIKGLLYDWAVRILR